MARKHCPHCLRPIPLKHRFKTKCPYCFRQLRRQSQDRDRSAIGLWLEDRGIFFWFFLLVVGFMLGAVTGQVSGHSDLLHYIDQRPIWFTLSLFYLALFASVIGRIYLPLMLDAPKILRRERAAIKQFKVMTAVGLVLGAALVWLVIGANSVFYIFSGSVLIFTIPVTLLWAYLGLVISEEEFEDQRIWSFLTELGCGERMEYRYRSYGVMVGIPLAALIFYAIYTHPGISWSIRDQIDLIKDIAYKSTHRVD